MHWGGSYYIYEGHSINKGNFLDWEETYYIYEGLSMNKRILGDWGGTYYIYEGHSINKGDSFKKKQNKFFQHFFPLFGIGLQKKIILITWKYLFWGYSKWWQINQRTLGLNRGLSSNVWWLRSANHIKSTKECVM